MTSLYCIAGAAGVFVLGAAIGSFLNVVIYRVPRGMAVSNPRRSFCPACRSQIPWHCNVPVLSWLLLRGRCRDCARPISVQYPLVEALTGAVFVMTGGLDCLEHVTAALPYWGLSSYLIAVGVIGLEREAMPAQLSLGASGLGAVGGIVLSLRQPWMSELGGLRGCAIGAGVAVSVVFARRLACEFARRRDRSDSDSERSSSRVAADLFDRSDRSGLQAVAMAACIGSFLGGQVAAASLLCALVVDALRGSVAMGSERPKAGHDAALMGYQAMFAVTALLVRPLVG